MPIAANYTLNTTGRIAELKAEIALLERGWDVYRPSCDRGVDLIAGTHRFQIKTAGKNKNDGYSFWLRGNGSNFFALEMRDIATWLIVPTSAFGVEIPRGITITPRELKTGKTSKWNFLLAYRDAWPMA
jgi:hypothetical protein